MLKIGGLIKHSLIDWPGKICCVIFTRGCDFRCPFCHNPELVYAESEESFPVSELSDFFRGSDVKWLDGVCVSGGEPLLYPDTEDLIDFIRKETGLPVKLDTNGTHPEMLESLLNSGKVDFVAVDIKHELTSEQYGKVTGVSPDLERIIRTISIVKEKAPDYQFRTTVIPGFHTMENVRRIAETLKVPHGKYVVQNFRPGRTLGKEFSILEPFGKEEFSKLVSAADGDW